MRRGEGTDLLVVEVGASSKVPCDVAVIQLQLPVFIDARKGVLDVDLALTARLDLGPDKSDAALKPLCDLRQNQPPRGEPSLSLRSMPLRCCEGMDVAVDRECRCRREKAQLPEKIRAS